MTQPFGDLFAKLDEIRRDPTLADSSRALAGDEKSDSQAISKCCANSSNSSRFSRSEGAIARAFSSSSEIIERKKVLLNDFNNLEQVEALAETGLPHAFPVGAAKAAKAAKVELSHSKTTGIALADSGESAAKVSVDRCRQAFSSLRIDVSPLQGVRDWSTIYSNMRRFLDGPVEQAEAFGWGEVELFGMHPQLGLRQVRYCGLLLLSICKPVVLVEPDRITTANRLVWRRGSIAEGAVSIFDMTKPQMGKAA